MADTVTQVVVPREVAESERTSGGISIESAGPQVTPDLDGGIRRVRDWPGGVITEAGPPSHAQPTLLADLIEGRKPLVGTFADGSVLRIQLRPDGTATWQRGRRHGDGQAVFDGPSEAAPGPAPAEDDRLDEFVRRFAGVRTILELGACKGEHTLRLAAMPDLQAMVAVEGRHENIVALESGIRERHLETVLPLEANLEKPEVLDNLGQFDVAVVAGILYHLPEPWRLLKSLAAHTGQLYVATHYSSEIKMTAQGYDGRWYQEPNPATDPLGGLSTYSFWPTLPALHQMLRDAGFTEIETLRTFANRNGPYTILIATKPPRDK